MDEMMVEKKKEIIVLSALQYIYYYYYTQEHRTLNLWNLSSVYTKIYQKNGTNVRTMV